MNYFKLLHSTNSDEIGIFDQIQRFQAMPNSLGIDPFKYIPLEGELDSEKVFPNLFLENNAKWTDLLHLVPGAGNFLVLSSAALSLIETYKVDVCQCYKVLVIRGGEVYTYHLLRFPWSRNRDYIDWEKSVFGHTTHMKKELIKEMQFQDYEEFYAFKKPLFEKNEHLIVRKLFLREEVIEKDIFRLLFISSGVYVSAILKEALQAAGISGCRFVPLAELGEQVLKEYYPHMFDQPE